MNKYGPVGKANLPIGFSINENIIATTMNIAKKDVAIIASLLVP